MPQTRRAAAAAKRRKSLRITNAANSSSADDQLLEKLVAYRNDLEAQFQQRLERLRRRLQDQEHAFSTTLNLCLARLPRDTRKMIFVDYLHSELGIVLQGMTSCKKKSDPEEDMHDISERVKRSARRTRRGATVDRTKRPPENTMTLTTVEEQENAPPSRTRAVRQLRAANTPASFTPLLTRTGSRRGPPLAASTGYASRTKPTKGALGLDRTAKKRFFRDKEDAFSEGGSPLINPFSLKHEDISKLRRNELSQLKRLKSKLDELLIRL